MHYIRIFEAVTPELSPAFACSVNMVLLWRINIVFEYYDAVLYTNPASIMLVSFPCF
jgi:hypothetical protein